MGGGSSTLLSQPWRTIPNTNKENFDFMNSYKPKSNEVKHLRILLHGPAGAGKSSFINTVDTVSRGVVCGRASTDATAGSSHTKKCKTYKILKVSSGSCALIFNDIMGFEANMSNGVHVEDIKLALAGHVKDGYEFNPKCPLTKNDPYYNSSPTLGDRVHVLISVFPADSGSLSDNVVEKMREVTEAATDLEIPQLTIITKVDKACPEVQKDINNTYRSIYLKKKVDEISQSLGIQQNSIFLLKNYESEDPNAALDTLILFTLREIISFGEEFLNDQ